MEKKIDFTKGKRGAVVASSAKTRITIYLDDDVLDAFKRLAEKQGAGYQTLINAALREALVKHTEKPVTAKTLRLILREELQAM
jgi:uncharacterized protein (DUF4415 family)